MNDVVRARIDPRLKKRERDPSQDRANALCRAPDSECNISKLADSRVAARVSLLGAAHCPFPSVTSRLPFPYHYIPGNVRVGLGKLLFGRNRTRLRAESRLPQTYADNSADTPIASLNGATPAHWIWPNNRQCALILSHDVDTTGQAQGILRLSREAQTRGICSTFSFVGETLDHYRPLIRELRAIGHEIALHDHFHDNRIAFLAEDQIVERLKPLADKIEEFGICGFRSPSWYTSAPLWRALNGLRFTYDMSALDTWSFFTSEQNYGARTLFPFRFGGLCVLPNTIPYDDAPRFSGYATTEILEFWRPKIEWISQNGGLIMLNAHPDSWWSGNKKSADVFGRTVDFILEHHSPAHMLGRDLAQHFNVQKQRGAVVQIDSDLEVPSHGRVMLEFTNRHANPMMINRARFLSTPRT
jgi:peptidoglycan/xylan/chitin deacetylase (PgdA/CDA1 family)